MKTFVRLLVCLIFMTIYYTQLRAQNTRPALDALFKRVFPVKGPGGTVLVSKKGKIIYNKAFGEANLELHVPMHTADVFRLGSLTKQFTAVCILKLAEEGKLSLGDTLNKFFADYPSGDKITIEQLLTHTAGIRNYTGLPAFNEQLKRTDLNPMQLISLFRNEPLDFEPGTRHLYSNSGYILLGAIIEKVSGISYATYLQRNLFDPLGMTHSSYDRPDTIIYNRVSGYRTENGHYRPAPFLSMTLPYAAGSLLSNTGDLLAWYGALSSGRVISKASLAGAFTSYRLRDGRETGYGYGWEVGNIQGTQAVRHTGVINGFFTDIQYLPDEELLVVILSNNERIGDLDVPASKAAAIALGKPFNFSPVTLTEKALSSFQGKYSHPTEGERIIQDQDGKLMYFTPGGGKSILVPYAENQFNLNNTLNTISFIRNTNGQITGYEIKGTGQSSHWSKTSETVEAVKSINLSLNELSQYTGIYLFDNQMQFEVLLQEGKLYGKVGQDKKQIIPFAPDKFYAKDLDAHLIFQRQADGSISAVIKMQNGKMLGKRIR